MQPERNCGYCDRVNTLTIISNGKEKCVFCQVEDYDITGQRADGAHIPYQFRRKRFGTLNPLHPDVAGQVPEYY